MSEYQKLIDKFVDNNYSVSWHGKDNMKRVFTVFLEELKREELSKRRNGENNELSYS